MTNTDKHDSIIYTPSYLRTPGTCSLQHPLRFEHPELVLRFEHPLHETVRQIESKVVQTPGDSAL